MYRGINESKRFGKKKVSQIHSPEKDFKSKLYWSTERNKFVNFVVWRIYRTGRNGIKTDKLFMIYCKYKFWDF